MEHIEGTFEVKDNLSLYYQVWRPPQPPRAVVAIIHGLADHSGRFGHLGNYLAARGCAVYAYDQRGHGRSGGRRCYTNSFADYTDDLERFLDKLNHELYRRPVFLLGHSMGGTIALTYSARHQHGLAGLLVSGPLIKPGPASRSPLLPLAGLLSALLPKAGTVILSSAAISRDNNVIDAYVHDPLVYRGKIPARTGIELLKAGKALPAAAPGLELPILIMHGTADRLSDSGGSRLLFANLGAKDKTLKLYEGFYHEILNEPGQAGVFKDIEEWLEARLPVR
jgi:acylglycerol lipase